MPIRRHQVSVKRLVQILLAAGAFCALIWLAITRWNGVPVIVDASETVIARTPIDPKEDRTEALLAAFTAIPPEPMWTLPPPPPGRRWKSTPTRVISPDELTAGPWSPETRPHMQAVIDHLLTPEVEAALAKFTALEPGGCRIVSAHASAIRRAMKLLVARARYHHAGREDVDTAIDDLSAALRLSGIAFNSADHVLMLTGSACEGYALAEIRFMAYERRLSRSQAARIMAAIEASLPPAEALWRNFIIAEVDQLTRALDLAYTCDEKGDGWLVLSRFDSMVWGLAPARPPRSGVWNLFSPIFNTRKTVAAKIEAIRESLEGAEKLSFEEGRATLKYFEEGQLLNLLDGPIRGVTLTNFASSCFTRYHRVDLSSRSAAVAAVALSTYHADHGNYPMALSELAGDYLNELPQDPFDKQPIRYVLKPDKDDFVLYCIGENLTDNGGQLANKKTNGGIQKDIENSDVLFNNLRQTDLWTEIKLEDISP